jgi:hypothetical protein
MSAINDSLPASDFAPRAALRNLPGETLHDQDFAAFISYSKHADIATHLTKMGQHTALKSMKASGNASGDVSDYMTCDA